MESQNERSTYSQTFKENYIKATFLYDSNLYEESYRYYSVLLHDNPTDIVALCMLALVNYKLGNTNDAVELSLVAHRLYPQLGLPRHLLRLIKNSPSRATSLNYSGFLSRKQVLELYRIYMPELIALPIYKDKDLYDNSATKHIDSEFLYFITRLFRPKHIIEFSPYHGLSTAFIYYALEANRQPYTFATFDLDEFEGFTKRMQRYGIPLNVIVGNAIATIPEYLRKRDLIGKIDFCFVDSEHTYQFAEAYTKAIFPLLAKGCVIMFHDMCYCPEQIEEPFNHYGPVKASEITGHLNSFGEGAYVSKFLRTLKGYRFFLTHKLFGGFGLLSPKLPINQALVNELSASAMGFRYKLSSVPNHEDRKITCMLIAAPEGLCELDLGALAQ